MHGVCRKLGLKKGDLVAVTETDEGMLTKPLSVAERTVGSPWLKQLYDLFVSVRQEVPVGSSRTNSARTARAQPTRRAISVGPTRSWMMRGRSGAWRGFAAVSL